MASNKYWLVTQAVIFQLIWLSAVVGGNDLLYVQFLLIGLHFILSPSRKYDARLLLLALPGLGIDVILTFLGVYEFSELPFWLALLWAGFVLNFGHSLRILTNLALPSLSIVGFLGGIYAYWLGWQLDAISFPHGGIISCLIVGTYWAALLPCLITFSKRILNSQT